MESVKVNDGYCMDRNQMYVVEPESCRNVCKTDQSGIVIFQIAKQLR